MTAALTRSHEKNSTVLSRSQNCCSVNEADFSCGGRLFQHVGPDTAKLQGTWAVAGNPGAWDQKFISEVHYEPLTTPMESLVAVADDYECRPTAAGRTAYGGAIWC